MTYYTFERQAGLGFDPSAVWSGLYTNIKDKIEV